MYITSGPIAAFDYLRVPYRVDPTVGAPHGFTAVVGDPQGGARRAGRLLWPTRDGVLLRGRTPIHRGVAGVAVTASMLDDDAMRSSLGAGWSSGAPAVETAGVWTLGEDRALPFDPGEALASLWSEGYLDVTARRARGLRAAAVRTYYLVRPVVPRRLQIALRRAFARVQRRSAFPAWPVDTTGMDLLALVHRLAGEIAGRPAPWIAPWPDGAGWALVLTHDVETAFGVSRIPAMLEIEASLGYRSSWNFVPRRYDIPPQVLAQLRAGECEIGLHGLYHDGRDLASLAMLRQRLGEMVSHAARLGAKGFRSPATQRAWELMAMLPFDYDSSYPDTDPYEPQPGGVCTWWPYRIGEVLELPLTLPQDHTLFVILGHRTAEAWLSKADAIRSRGGMALMLTHPDYLSTSAQLQPYRELLERHAADSTSWKALPREVAAWWRERESLRIVADGRDGWRIEGSRSAADRAAVVEHAP
jgi:hypothetical protein